MSLASAAPPSSARVRAPSRLIARTPSATGRHRRRVVVRGSSTKADEAGAPATVEQRKRRLVQLCARTDRGKSATPEVAAEIESIVAALEANGLRPVTRGDDANTLVYGYHDPFITPNFMRRNEVCVRVEDSGRLVV